MRTIQNLNENWLFYKTDDPAEGQGVTVTLPHTWNAADGQDGGGDYYRGRCWYTRPLDKADLPPLQNGARAWLEFEGAALEAEGFSVSGVVESPITGPEGNVEYLVRAVYRPSCG